MCTDIRICSDDNRHGLTTGGSGSDHSAWELGGESHNPDSVCISGSACEGVLRGTGTTDCSTARVSPSTSGLIVDDVPSGWSASRWWSPRDSYGVAASEHSSEASGWAGGSCGIHERVCLALLLLPSFSDTCVGTRERAIRAGTPLFPTMVYYRVLKGPRSQCFPHTLVGP